MNNIDQVACDSAREIMELVSGKMSVGGLPQLQAMVQNIVAEAMRSGGEPVVVGWIYEDELSENYPYDQMFPFSKVDIVRMFPVYAPTK